MDHEDSPGPKLPPSCNFCALSKYIYDFCETMRKSITPEFPSVSLHSFTGIHSFILFSHYFSWLSLAARVSVAGARWPLGEKDKGRGYSIDDKNYGQDFGAISRKREAIHKLYKLEQSENRVRWNWLLSFVLSLELSIFLGTVNSDFFLVICFALELFSLL